MKNLLTKQDKVILDLMKDLEQKELQNITSKTVYTHNALEKPENSMTFSAITAAIHRLYKKGYLYKKINTLHNKHADCQFCYSTKPFSTEINAEIKSEAGDIDFESIYNHLLNQVRPTFEKILEEDREEKKAIYEDTIKKLEGLIDEKNKEIDKWKAINTENQDVIRGYVCQIKDYIKKCQLQDADIQAQEKAKGNALNEILKLKEDIKLLQNKNYNLLCKTKQEEFNEKVYELCSEIRLNK